MSKKNKKFQKRLREQILKEVQQTDIPQSAQRIPDTDTQKATSDRSTFVKKEQAATYQDSTPVAKNEEFKYVKYDLKKSAIIIGSIFIVIFALYFIDNKTGILLNAGEFVFKVLHISQ